MVKNKENMRILRENLERAMKLMLNEQYQEAIPLVNNGILQCKKIEKEREKKG